MRISDWSSDVCSSDLLGAVGGLLFDIGSGRFPAPPRSDSTENARDWTAMLDETSAQAQKLDKAVANQKESDRTHGEIQSWLSELGLALEFGRASCRGRECQYVYISVVSDPLKKKSKLKNQKQRE